VVRGSLRLADALVVVPIQRLEFSFGQLDVASICPAINSLAVDFDDSFGKGPRGFLR